jgi:formylmethanofuran dehydrogenase subunit C
MIHLRLKRLPSVPLEAEVLTPDVLRDLGHREICGLTVYHGKRQLRLDEFFEIEGEKSEHLHLEGDMHKLRWVGRSMTSGSIRITGNIGMHLGSQMRGGVIEVDGDAGDWLGAEMRSGTIRVHGSAGGQVGAAYRGSPTGMRNGFIHVGGQAGMEVGMRMRRGTIVVGGSVRDFAGLQMKGGTIVLLGGGEIRSGAWMTRGTIISLEPLQLMPTFRSAGILDSPFLAVLARFLAVYGIELPSCASLGHYLRYTGDAAAGGQGELLLWHVSASAS